MRHTRLSEDGLGLVGGRVVHSNIMNKTIKCRPTRHDIDRKDIFMKERLSGAYTTGISLIIFVLCLCALGGIRARANSVKDPADVHKPDMYTYEALTGSDLVPLYKTTKLDSRRWIQSFAFDDKYYYYIQLTNPYKGHLRITRVKHAGFGRYIKDHMDLMYFGHGTNLDCSTYNGVTYLWTGSDAASGEKAGGTDVSRAITCFPYKKNSVLRNSGLKTFRIINPDTGHYATNVYPAVNEKNNKLAVRFTYKGRQYFQTYTLMKGTTIDTNHPLRTVSFPKTSGDFQGFDLYGSNIIYTVEGSPSETFLSSYDKSRIFQPTILTTWNMATRMGVKRMIDGEKNLSFREPEGIKVKEGKEIQLMFVSFRLTDQYCNVYRLKKW